MCSPIIHQDFSSEMGCGVGCRNGGNCQCGWLDKISVNEDILGQFLVERMEAVWDRPLAMAPPKRLI
jgi:hypothetical protein